MCVFAIGIEDSLIMATDVTTCFAAARGSDFYLLGRSENRDKMPSPVETLLKATVAFLSPFMGENYYKSVGEFL
jgi:hypothetical protein